MNVTACISEINEKHNLPGRAGLYTAAANHKDVGISKVAFVHLSMLKSICPTPILKHG